MGVSFGFGNKRISKPDFSNVPTKRYYAEITKTAVYKTDTELHTELRGIDREVDFTEPKILKETRVWLLRQDDQGALEISHYYRLRYWLRAQLREFFAKGNQ